MKIQLLSDLHNEFYRTEPPPLIDETAADVVVLVGDIGVGIDGLRWAESEGERIAKPILYVAGNHEFYHHDIALLAEMRNFAAVCEWVRFLENDELVIDGVRFLGCTLWTDYQIAGDPVISMMQVQQGISDHHVISNGEGLFMPEDALRNHQRSRAWLKKYLSQPFVGKTVVITHHAPHKVCAHPSFPINAISSAFMSDLSELVTLADVWCFGHTHSNLDVSVGGCRIIANQRGYPLEIVPDYDPRLVITVD